jgi:hypothetical protein
LGPVEEFRAPFQPPQPEEQVAERPQDDEGKESFGVEEHLRLA